MAAKNAYFTVFGEISKILNLLERSAAGVFEVAEWRSVVKIELERFRETLGAILTGNMA